MSKQQRNDAISDLRNFVEEDGLADMIDKICGILRNVAHSNATTAAEKEAAAELEDEMRACGKLFAGYVDQHFPAYRAPSQLCPTCNQAHDDDKLCLRCGEYCDACVCADQEAEDEE